MLSTLHVFQSENIVSHEGKTCVNGRNGEKKETRKEKEREKKPS